jgi:hypothetical protein
MATIPKPAFPNVPALPGVPQVPRSNLFPAAPPPALNAVIALGRLALSLTSKPTWGVYKVTQPPAAPGADGLETVVVSATPPPPVIIPDSYSRFQYKQEWSVSSAPVQEGGFASYNKVASPYEITLKMVKGGTLSDRKTFLANLETVAASLDLYKVVTPERAYINANITGFRVTRDGAQGAYFLTEVEVSFLEVRPVQAQYTSTGANTTNAQNPSAQPVANQGTLNSTPPASRLQTTVDSVLGPLRSLANVIGAG